MRYPVATPSPLDPVLAALLASRRDGVGMPRAFYATEALYAAELQRIWQSGWLFAGFALEVPNPGDFLTLSVGDAPVLVIRGDEAWCARSTTCAVTAAGRSAARRAATSAPSSARTTAGPIRSGVI